MVNESIILNSVEPIANIVSSAVNILQVFIGGVFGLYLILAFLKWKESRDIKKSLKHIELDLKKVIDIMGQHEKESAESKEESKPLNN